jgi:predicted XRE-type DNA-binding protein
MARRTAIDIEPSSGNVFADLGFPEPEPEPELEQFKATLMLQIYRIIKGRKLTQIQAGKVLGIKQPNVSRLMRESSGSYCVDRLMEFLTALGQNVEVTIRPARKKHGAMSVTDIPITVSPVRFWPSAPSRSIRRLANRKQAAKFSLSRSGNSFSACPGPTAAMRIGTPLRDQQL